MKKDWRKGKLVNIILHAIAWLLLFSLPALLRPAYHTPVSRSFQQAGIVGSSIITGLNYLLLILFFYLNTLMIIPALLYKKRYFGYGVSVCSLLVILVTVMWLLKTNSGGQHHYFFFSKLLLFNIFSFLFILACSLAYRSTRDKIRAEKNINETKAVHLKTEVSMLRSQVSPKFIFNALNSMAVQARKGSDQLETSLIKFSSLMRYMLYETGYQKVSLQRETEHLQNYISFQQQQFGHDVIVNATMYHPDKEYDIEPMLLIPIVENTFTHGTGAIDKAFIEINMKAEKNILFFSFVNRCTSGSLGENEKVSGSSLLNVKKRLALLYPGKHTLDITKDNGLLTGLLTIELN